jgi:hypothetical protein
VRYLTHSIGAGLLAGSWNLEEVRRHRLEVGVAYHTGSLLRRHPPPGVLTPVCTNDSPSNESTRMLAAREERKSIQQSELRMDDLQQRGVG